MTKQLCSPNLGWKLVVALMMGASLWAEAFTGPPLYFSHSLKPQRVSGRGSGPQQFAAGGEPQDSSPEPTRTPTLPTGDFRPKQSLGQNYLSDQNYVLKICSHIHDNTEDGSCLIELGPGAGALTQVLYRRYPSMTAVDIDERAVDFLKESLPGLSVVESDVLQIDYTSLAGLKGDKLTVVGNLPYHITSQILFSLCDHYESIRESVVTMQLEVAQRIVAKPGCKEYGILSVVFQLYGTPRILFQIPPTVFYPQPKVKSALLGMTFSGKGLDVDQEALRKVLSTAFQQRRKMLRQSLKHILQGKTLPDKFATKRPEQLTPQEFIELTVAVCGDSVEQQGVTVWRKMRG
ncbi:unnamed protein product [Chrysoparadoxa australica]